LYRKTAELALTFYTKEFMIISLEPDGT
jgi:hypothetical protein